MTRDRMLGVFLIATAISLGMIASQIDFISMTGDPGPKLFPYFACSILLLCGAAMLLQAAPHEELPQFDRRFWKRAGAVFVSLIGYAVLLWAVGFHLATPVMLLAFYWQMSLKGQFNLFWGIFYAAVTYGLVFTFFSFFLGSYLPEGVLL